MNRCVAITKNNTKCRAKTKDNRLFCCERHEPINNEIIENGCFLCMDKIEKSNDIIYFHCKHAFHKPCYLEWLNYSTYEEPICIICRTPINKKNEIINIKIIKKICNMQHFDNISNLLQKNNLINT